MSRKLGKLTFWAGTWGILASILVTPGSAQTTPYERSFPQSKSVVEKAVKEMQATLAGRLPALEGFAKTGEHPLERYSRGYYQATIQVSSNPSGGSQVRVTAKVTAWYADPSASKSGYQLLTSNGRLEADLLDHLAEQLGITGNVSGTPLVGTAAPSQEGPASASPAIAPAPQFPVTDRRFSSSASEGLASAERAGGLTREQRTTSRGDTALQTEANSLAEILKNQAHPKNLIAVKKSGTPVVDAPSLNAKAEFFASMHDEFELLNFTADWVHVRISGLSRGWIWRNSVEMPDGIPDTEDTTTTSQAPAADLFQVVREETAPFPGDWEPLRSKNVKIISVQKIDETAKNAGPKERLEYAKFLLEKSYAEIAQPPHPLAGMVVIFDSADGGMIAATLAALQQWRAGALSDSAFWHKCFFDPPEIFDSTLPSGSQ